MLRRSTAMGNTARSCAMACGRGAVQGCGLEISIVAVGVAVQGMGLCDGVWNLEFGVKGLWFRV